MLELQGVTKNFSGLTALSEVDLRVEPGTIKGLIGPNGAGKTTLFNVVTGVFPPSRGKVLFRDRPLSGLPADRIANRGIFRTFQHPHLFKSLTVLENTLLGGHRFDRSGFWTCGLQTRGAKKEARQAQERALEHLELLGLSMVRDNPAGALPLGQQRYVEVCRALAAEPKLLLLDEPTAGLNDRETEDFKELAFKIRDLGVTLFVIEHHMKFIMEVCDDIAVLNFGELIASGSPREIQDSPAVIEAYLGTEEDID
jgi:branched-chain amino acid transport system ATP-binding protein